jgi:hypothetical protein
MLPINEMFVPFRSNQLQYMTQPSDEKPIDSMASKLFSLESTKTDKKNQGLQDGRLLDLLLQPHVEEQAIEVIARHLQLDKEQSTYFFRYLFFNVKRAMHLGDNRTEDYLFDLDKKLRVLKTEFTNEQIRCNNAFVFYSSEVLTFRINLLRSFRITPIRPVHVMRFETIFNLHPRLLKKYCVIPTEFDGLKNLLDLIPNMSERQKQTEIVDKLPGDVDDMSFIQLHRKVLELYIAHRFKFDSMKRMRHYSKANQTLLSSIAVGHLFERHQLIQPDMPRGKRLSIVLAFEHDDLIQFLHDRPVLSGHSMLELLYKHPRTILNEPVFAEILTFLSDFLQIDQRHLVGYFSLFSVKPATIKTHFQFWCDVFGLELLRNNKLTALHLLAYHHTAKQVFNRLLASIQIPSGDSDQSDLFAQLTERLNIPRVRPPLPYCRLYEPGVVDKLADCLQTSAIHLQRCFEKLPRKELHVTLDTCRSAQLLLDSGWSRSEIVQNIDILLGSFEQLQLQLKNESFALKRSQHCQTFVAT